MVKCCYCEYESSAHGVRTHIALVHSTLAPPRSWGRPKGRVCALCGWSHTDVDDTPRPGWGNRRKRFERGKLGAVLGSVPPRSGFFKLGELKVPEGAKRLKRITISIEPCRGPFLGPRDEQGRRYCVSCERCHLVAAESQ